MRVVPSGWQGYQDGALSTGLHCWGYRSSNANFDFCTGKIAPAACDSTLAPKPTCIGAGGRVGVV
jgi:hypothetical protein